MTATADSPSRTVPLAGSAPPAPEGARAAPALEDAPSPCVKLCAIGPDGETCQGCGRTRHEIAGWSRMSIPEKHAVLRRLGVAA